LGLAELLINITELLRGRFAGVLKLRFKILGKLANKLCLGGDQNTSWMKHLDLA
jgi:hypothetical protein